MDTFEYRKYRYENKNIDKYRDRTVKIKQTMYLLGAVNLIPFFTYLNT